MKKIIVDTNALMAISEFRLDLFSVLEESCDFPYQLTILTGTVAELKQIKDRQQGKFKRAAKLVLDIIKAKKISIIKDEGKVDDLLISHSRRGDLILTLDAQLKKKLSRPYLTIKQKKRIILVE